MNVPEANAEFEKLLDYLKYSQGCDLTGYKRSTLMRRFRHRMQGLGIAHYQTYLEYLQSHSEEYLSLLNDVLINVTCFFRDREVWDYLAQEIIPRIIANRQPDEPIRVWSAGCAAGQEIYSLLMLLAETLGLEFCLKHVQCFATDLDEEALRQARQATYNDLEVIGVPADLLEKYFEKNEQSYVFHSKLRYKVIFGHHDLVKDAPISKIDLLICRNVQIYFQPKAQASLLVRCHVALKKTGFLLLGKTEILTARREIFTLINLKHRVYAKGLTLHIEDYLSMKQNPHQKVSADPLTCFLKTAFETSPVAQLTVDCNGYLIHANRQANVLFGLSFQDWKRPFQELEIGKQLASYTSTKTFYRNRHQVTLKAIEWFTSQSIQYFDVAIAPVFNFEKQFLGITLTWVNTTEQKRLAQKLDSTDSQLAGITARLHNLESELKATQMELEAAHQEIQLLAQNTT